MCCSLTIIAQGPEAGKTLVNDDDQVRPVIEVFESRLVPKKRVVVQYVALPSVNFEVQGSRIVGSARG